MKTHICTAIENAMDSADLAAKQLKALTEPLDDKTREVLNLGELAAYMAKLRYHVEHLDNRLFNQGS